MSRTPSVSELVENYLLKPHPEGGFFCETYRSEGQMESFTDSQAFGGPRRYSTAIYFLLTEGNVSRFHRIRSDEIWHFYLGGPMTLVQISPQGMIQEITLGQDIKKGHQLQVCVPKGSWFASFSHPGEEYSFVGCTVSPGFDFQDFELAKAEELLLLYPHARHWIEKLT